jgi:hypothetical protein
VDTGLDQNQTELGVLVLAVALQVLAHVHGLESEDGGGVVGGIEGNGSRNVQQGDRYLRAQDSRADADTSTPANTRDCLPS